MSVRFIPYQSIDSVKWDACIDNASNGLIYGYSFYLDNMAAQWDGLVLNDYDAVMPLCWKKKYGISYLYQPYFTASLGVFGNHLHKEIVASFLAAIPKKFAYWDFYLNAGNLFQMESYSLYERNNFVLSLNREYLQIRNGYRENVSRNVKKSIQYSCVVNTDIDIKQVIALSASQASAFSNLAKKDFENFERLYLLLHQKKQAITYGVFAANGELVASCVFLFSNNRAYYVLVGNHPNGKTMGASHFMIDTFICNHANSNLLLDFEGSDVPSLAFFYSSFGATIEKYPGIKLNRMPWWLRWLKK